MKVRITGRGIYGAEGEVPIGTVVVAPSVIPPSWTDKCEVVSGPESEDEDKELSKADLIQQAEELGIDVKSSWNKDKLQEEIDAVLAE